MAKYMHLILYLLEYKMVNFYCYTYPNTIIHLPHFYSKNLASFFVVDKSGR